MKHTWKRCLAMLLALLMLSAMSLMAMAEEYDEFDSFDDFGFDDVQTVAGPEIISARELFAVDASRSRISDAARELYAPIAGTVVRVPVFAAPNESLLKAKDAFEQEFGCTLQFEVYGWNDWRTKLIQMVASKNVPDVVPIFDEQFVTYVTQGVVQPIDNYVDLNDPVWDRQLSELYSWGGHVYGAASEADVITIYYNKDLVAEYGLEDPYALYLQGKWDFEAFRQTAKALTVFEGDKRRIIGFSTWITDVLCLANGNTGVVINEDGTITPTLQEKSWLEGMELTQRMIIEDKSFDPGDTSPTKFLSGRVGMYAERADYSISQYNMYEDAPFEIGFVPLPKGPSTQGELAPAIVESFGVPTGAKNPLGGMAWRYFLEVYSYNRYLLDDEEAWASFYKKWTDEHYCQYLDYMSRATLQCSFINGIGDWFTKRWGLLMEIQSGTPPAVAVEAHIGELLFEIRSMTGQQ